MVNLKLAIRIAVHGKLCPVLLIFPHYKQKCGPLCLFNIFVTIHNCNSVYKFVVRIKGVKRGLPVYGCGTSHVVYKGVHRMSYKKVLQLCVDEPHCCHVTPPDQAQGGGCAASCEPTTPCTLSAMAKVWALPAPHMRCSLPATHNKVATSYTLTTTAVTGCPGMKAMSAPAAPSSTRQHPHWTKRARASHTPTS